MFCRKIKYFLMYFFQKLQAIYPKKRASPTLSYYVEFNHEHFKDDKVIAGVINFMFILFLIITSATTSVYDLVEDSKPYINSMKVPYASEY